MSGNLLNMENFKIILGIAILLIICIMFIKQTNNIENMATITTEAISNNEALQDVASLYNQAEMTVTNLNTTGKANVNSLSVTSNATIGESVQTINLNTSGQANVNSLAVATNATVGGYVQITGSNNQYNLNVPYVALLKNNQGQVQASGPYNNGGVPYSLMCSGSIAAQEYDAYSSIKRKVVLQDNGPTLEQEAQHIIESINFCKYEPKDIIGEGNRKYYGVIAEEIKGILPDYVKEGKDYVPNIYCDGELSYIEENNYRIVLDKFDMVDIHLIENKIRLHTKNELPNNIIADILSYTHNNKSIEIVIKIEGNLIENQVMFIYGTYEICPSVSKDRLGELALFGTQILFKQISELQKQVVELQKLNYNLMAHIDKSSPKC